MGDDKSKPTEIDVRVNDGEWIHIDGVPLTDSWNTVSVVSKEINLKKGNNKIDVTGAAMCGMVIPIIGSGSIWIILTCGNRSAGRRQT